VVSRSKTIAMAVVVWKKLLQDVMFVVPDPFKQTFVGVLNELSQCRVTVSIEAEPNTLTDGVCWKTCKPSPGWGSIEQLVQHYCYIYVSACRYTYRDCEEL